MLVRPGALMTPWGGNRDVAVFAAANGALFDGTNDDITRAGLIGASDSKLFTLSYWINFTGLTESSTYEVWTGYDTTIFTGAAWAFNSGWFTDINFEDSGGTIVMRGLSSSDKFVTAGNSGVWKHFMMSVDLTDTGKRHMYLDDVVLTPNWAVYTNANMNFTLANWFIGSNNNINFRLDGCLQEFYLNFGEYIDLSVESNRRKFITAAGKPANLGADGSTPTGTSPIMYFSNPFGTFEDNNGTGGDFTVHGALADCGSSPSD